MKGKTNIYILTLAAMSLGMTALEVVTNLKESMVSESTQGLWGLIFVFVTVLWVQNDSKKNGFERPFDFGFLIYIFWPISFPWYLIFTRGMEGFVLFLGFISFWIGPWLAGLVAYAYFT